MSAPGTAALTVLRGNPTPEELASLLVVFAALRGGAPDPAGQALGGARRRWGRPAGWKHTHTAAEADPAIWQRNPAPTHERTGR
ncbi:acyl-CoA carboxylase subunit epsilon [Streptacidiphilus pinicola]|uniref:Acyl-CoA carboxylase subunit epsilon n=1 Tax=Streptacidiphilus pinicola TaxID=2219663 RepID=A0A2X0IQ46_9ACTN|nr:acyl-CoA carboxylase subunit epsilon [Streptacidiphilus pinicola]RAG85311.1 acyl-CoA carboxylase subunit epsilon [Streptacidiphilus pinicola]